MSSDDCATCVAGVAWSNHPCSPVMNTILIGNDYLTFRWAIRKSMSLLNDRRYGMRWLHHVTTCSVDVVRSNHPYALVLNNVLLEIMCEIFRRYQQWWLVGYPEKSLPRVTRLFWITFYLASCMRLSHRCQQRRSVGYTRSSLLGV